MKIIEHATIAMKRPAGPPAATRETSALAGGAWFEAGTPAGLLRLYAARTVRHAADAAVALGRCESLLTALDAWLGAVAGAPLDWRWIASPGAVTASATHARAHWQPGHPGHPGQPGQPGQPAPADDFPRTQDKADVACRLELPWSLLRAVTAPPAELAAQLHWPEIPMVLAASQWQIADDELALLEPGGAVVLPASLQAAWSGSLRALDERAAPGSGVPVDLTAPQSPRRHPLPASTGLLAATDGAWCEVRLMLPHSLPGDRLAGWFEGPLSADPAVAAALTQASLWYHAAGAPARCLASGSLMPWADGWALAVEQVGI